MTRWAALLRGVNVGGRKLAMADLRAMLTEMGFADVATLLASGNAVFSAQAQDGAALERALETAAARVLGLETDFLVRDGAGMAAVLAANPFPEVAVERPQQLVVLFHRDPVDPALLGMLADVYKGPERLAARALELYIDFPEGQGRSNLYPAMAKLRFPKVATARNWNTVARIAAKLAG